MLNSRNIGREEFIIIVATTCKKDPWMRTISGLFVESCCAFKRIFKSYATKNKMDREAINQIRKNQKKERQEKQTKCFFTTTEIVVEREQV